MRRALRLLLAGLAGVVLVVAIALATLWIWIRSPGGQGWAAEVLTRQVSALFETGSVQVERIGIGWGSITLSDVRVHGTEHRDVLVVPRARARLDR